MHPFETIAYLQHGSPRQQEAFLCLHSLGIMTTLVPFDPLLCGTVPIGIDGPESDLDIICCYGEAKGFIETVRAHFGNCSGFLLSETEVGDRRTVLASFTYDGFPFEVFGQARPVREQEAWRHLVVEAHLLQVHGEPLRAAVLQLRANGLKTEPAFAQALGLPGDPYAALLAVYDTIDPVHDAS
ncbi:DUF4269 domain-containing protein [Flaviaesturariibacter amylovorans]|uniref:DUF4269 domain-containing protein n=1 Tax=Flaviaesturariibacter amylovorans TaxID=1084520 RepID=A0ABP8HU35_9BACT